MARERDPYFGPNYSDDLDDFETEDLRFRGGRPRDERPPRLRSNADFYAGTRYRRPTDPDHDDRYPAGQPNYSYGSRYNYPAPRHENRPGGYRQSDYDDFRNRGHRDFLDRASDEVSSWFGDEDAAQRRRTDHRGRGPKGYTRSDDRIAEDLNDRLTDDWFLDASDIEVSVKASEVTLDGEVTSRSDKRRAEDIADDVSGVINVQNNLRIRSADTSSQAAA
ncbi:BON domain-containing protein [Mesorhizobium sp. 1M-11]|uniref:BON domain-containing protein n=1 Tax=Mesorhizobium sp. 1M-11 TaxID=1529006 RepID=UPI0006C743F3|nr:BON domain-containing protein [Mesorhizobium sp. 1M-11]